MWWDIKKNNTDNWKQLSSYHRAKHLIQPASINTHTWKRFYHKHIQNSLHKTWKWIPSLYLAVKLPTPTWARVSTHPTVHLCDFSLIVTTWPHSASLSSLNPCTHVNICADQLNASHMQCWGEQLQFQYFLSAVGDTGRMALTVCAVSLSVLLHNPSPVHSLFSLLSFF